MSIRTGAIIFFVYLARLQTVFLFVQRMQPYVYVDRPTAAQVVQEARQIAINASSTILDMSLKIAVAWQFFVLTEILPTRCGLMPELCRVGAAHNV